jgi:hypothetical protein
VGEDQPLVSDLDHIIEVHAPAGLGLECNVIDAGSVSSAEVLDVMLITLHQDAAMLAADERVFFEIEVGSRATEHQAVPERNERAFGFVKEIECAHFYCLPIGLGSKQQTCSFF